MLIYDQVRWQWGVNEKIIASYEILCITAMHCTEHRHGAEKKGMPDALSLINMNDACHLKHLTWAVYSGALVVGGQPEFVGNLPWHTVLASLHKHIYRGCEDVVHCLPFMLPSWDCKERVKVLHHEGWLNAEQSRAEQTAVEIQVQEEI